MGIRIVLQQWMGRVWIEVHQVDQVGKLKLIARRRIPWEDLLVPSVAIRMLRDELPFLEALIQSDAWAQH